MTKKKKPATKPKPAAKPKAKRKRNKKPGIGEIHPLLLAKLQSVGPPISPSLADLANFPDAAHTTKKRRFLIACAATAGNITRAAVAAGIDRRTHFKWMEEPEYKLAFEAVRIEAAHVLEDEARRRAFEGVLKGVYHAGLLVDFELEYSDHLMAQLLRANHPAHKQTNVTLQGSGKDGAIAVTLARDQELAKLPEDELLARTRVLRDALEYATGSPAGVEPVRERPPVPADE